MNNYNNVFGNNNINNQNMPSNNNSNMNNNMYSNNMSSMQSNMNNNSYMNNGYNGNNQYTNNMNNNMYSNSMQNSNVNNMYSNTMNNVQNNANGPIPNSSSNDMIFFSLQDGTAVNDPNAVNNSQVSNGNSNSNNFTSPDNSENGVWISEKGYGNHISSLDYYKHQSTDELVNAYMRGNRYKVQHSFFSIPGFLLSFLYLFYIKMFFFGIIISVVYLFLLLFVFPKFHYVFIVSNVVMGLVTNRLYLLTSKFKVRRIIETHPFKTPEELKTICILKGRTNLSSIVSGVFLDFALLVACVFILPAMGYSEVLKPYDSVLLKANSRADTVIKELSNKFGGQIHYNSKYKVKNYFLIYVPSVFKNNSGASNYKYSYTSESGVLNDCKFSLNAVKYYDNPETFINDLHEYNANNNPSSVSKIVVNDSVWNTFDFDSISGRMSYYTTSLGDIVFLLEFEKQENAPGDCDSYKEKIINSIISE